MMSNDELMIEEAAERGDVDEVERLLDEGVEVDSEDGVSVFCTLLAHLGAVWDSSGIQF